MCNAYEQHVKWVGYVQMMQALELNIPTQQTEFDLRAADDIRINDAGSVACRSPWWLMVSFP